MTTELKPKFVTEEGFGYDLKPGGSPFHVTLSDGRLANFYGHPHLMRVELAEVNNLLSDHGAPRIQGGGRAKIWSDDYQIYSFRFEDIQDAVFRLVQVLDRIQNFPVPIRERSDCEALIGRKVFWREFPAVIADYDGVQGTVRLTADNGDKRFISEPWDEQDGKYFGSIREDLLSPKIYWFREE